MINLVDGIFEDLPGLLRVLRAMAALRWVVERSRWCAVASVEGERRYSISSERRRSGLCEKKREGKNKVTINLLNLLQVGVNAFVGLVMVECVTHLTVELDSMLERLDAKLAPRTHLSTPV